MSVSGAPHFAGGRPGPLAGDAHDAAHRLGHEVEAAAMAVGTGASEAGERAVDQPRIALPQVLIVEAQLGERAGPVVLDHDVGVLQQPAQHAFAALGLEVERHARACCGSSS